MMEEFWNNIWIAISTPNEGLVKLLSIPLFFIEIPLILYLITTIFNLKLSKKQKIIFLASNIIIGIINLYFIPNPFNIIINYCIKEVNLC